MKPSVAVLRFSLLSFIVFQPLFRPVAEPVAITSLANPNVKFSVPPKPCVSLKHGELTAVICDNRAVNDETLPGHRPGYHGVASLTSSRGSRNLFVPQYAGLNFEHIHDGTTQAREILFEPRHAPMILRSIDERTAELYQPPTPFWGLESCLRYQLIDEETIELTFECIPRRAAFKNGYIGLFWASYIHEPASRDTHFLSPHPAEGPRDDRPGRWVRASSPEHGIAATHLAAGDKRVFAHSSDFPLELVFNNSPHQYLEPWFYGVCRGMAFVQVFRPQDQVRLTQSPSGGGDRNPAWDFQWFIPDPVVGKRYQLVMRALYRVHETAPHNPFGSEHALLSAIRKAQTALNR